MSKKIGKGCMVRVVKVLDASGPKRWVGWCGEVICDEGNDLVVVSFGAGGQPDEPPDVATFWKEELEQASGHGNSDSGDGRGNADSNSLPMAGQW